MELVNCVTGRVKSARRVRHVGMLCGNYAHVQLTPSSPWATAEPDAAVGNTGAL